MKHDYGDENRPRSYEYVHILESLQNRGYQCVFFDYMDFIKKNSKENLQKKLIELTKRVNTELSHFFTVFRSN